MPVIKENSTRALRTQRAAIQKEARGLADKGELTAAEQARFASLMQRSRDLKEEIDNVESSMFHEIRGGQPTSGPEYATQQRSDSDESEKEYRRVFSRYLRGQMNELEPEERSLLQTRRSNIQAEFRDMGTGGGGAGLSGTTSGGFFVPVGFIADIVRTLKFTGPMVDDSQVNMMVTETGQVLPYPSENDVAVTGERVGEGQQVSTADVSLGNVIFNAYKYSSKVVKVSIELLQDSAFDLDSFLTNQFALRLGRVLNSDLTLGTGTNQPNGIVTATLANGPLVTATGSVANDGTGGADTIGTDDFVNLEHQIDKLLRPGASFMAHDSTWKVVKRTKDKYGRPIYTPSLSAGMPDTILGYPMLTNNYMDVLQSNLSSPPVTRNTVLFGNLKTHYMVRRVRDLSILVLKERWGDLGQVGYIGFMRLDGNVLAGPSATGSQYPFALLQNIA